MSLLSEVLERLPCLASEELDQVRTHVTMLRGAGSPSTSQSSHWLEQQLTLEAIEQYMRGRGLEYTSASSLRSSSSFNAFKDKIPALWEFIRAGSTERNEQRALLLLGVRLLYDNLKSMNIPVSSVTLMNHIHRVPSMINLAFPGYAEAGLLGFATHKDSE